METISITFNGGRGHMTLMLGEFFPTSSARVRKLLGIIREDYAHEDELRAAIVQHCTEKAAELTESLRELANLSVDYRTKAAEMQPDIDHMETRIKIEQHYLDTRHIDKATAKMYREQLKAEKEKLRDMKSSQRFNEKTARSYAADFKRAKSTAEKLKANAEVVKNG